MIATHIDTNHLHNHLVVNSVSCENGKKLHQNRDTLLTHRQLNDEICIAHGLCVLEEPEKYTKKKRMKPGEYQAGLRADSWNWISFRPSMKHWSTRLTGRALLRIWSTRATR